MQTGGNNTLLFSCRIESTRAIPVYFLVMRKYLLCFEIINNYLVDLRHRKIQSDLRPRGGNTPQNVFANLDMRLSDMAITISPIFQAKNVKKRSPF